MTPELIVLDVDGTSVGRDQIVPADLVDVLRELASQGIWITLATGRNLTETVPVWRQLDLGDRAAPLITNGGAIVSEAATQRTLYQKSIAPAMAREFSEALSARGLSTAANVDRWRSDFDILAVPSDNYVRTKSCWFDRMDKLVIREMAELDTSSPNSPDVLRINAVLPEQDGDAITQELAQEFAGRLDIHAINAPNYGVFFLEAFAPGSNKWAAVQYIAQGLRLGPAAICTAGDDINDLPMIVGAGMGLAMPTAPDSVKTAANATVETTLADALRPWVA